MKFTLPILALVFGIHHGPFWAIFIITLGVALRFLPSLIVLEVMGRLIFTAMQNRRRYTNGV